MKWTEQRNPCSRVCRWHSSRRKAAPSDGKAGTCKRLWIRTVIIGEPEGKTAMRAVKGKTRKRPEGMREVTERRHCGKLGSEEMKGGKQ